MRVFLMLCLAVAEVHAQTAPGFDLGAVNRSVDPCANFYQYACGGWMTANPLPSDASRWGRFDALQDRNRMVLKDVLEEAAADLVRIFSAKNPTSLLPVQIRSKETLSFISTSLLLLHPPKTSRSPVCHPRSMKRHISFPATLNLSFCGASGSQPPRPCGR